MKQIVFVTGSMGRGGAERVISILCQRFVQCGWHVTIVQLLKHQVDYEIDPSVEVLDFSNNLVSPSKDAPRLIVKLRRFLKKKRPDVVVAFMASICMVAGLACIGLRTRLVVSERNDPTVEAEAHSAAYRAILNWVYTNSDCTVVQTKRAQNYFPEKVRKNSVIIPNPIQVEHFADEHRTHRIVTAGRLAPQKNQKMLINAFSAFHKDHPEYTLDIYGDGALREELQKLIYDLDLENAVTLHGSISDVHAQIKNAEMFALSSDYEGLSNALLEAMMMGLPCISTDCAGSDEMIRDGENGLLVPVGDAEQMAMAMKRFAEQPGFARSLGDAARKSSEQFAVETVMAKWQKAIEG